MQKRIKHNMPWTEVYDHATFSTPSRLAMSFWLAHESCVVDCSSVFSLALLISPRWFGLGVMLALVLALPGLLWPQAIARPYRVWNRLARYFGRAAQPMADGHLLLYYFRGSGTDRVIPPAGSPDSYHSRSGSLGERLHRVPMSASMVPQPERLLRRVGLRLSSHGLSQSGNIWALSLLPFFILLSALQIDQKKSNFPANIYTLF